MEVDAFINLIMLEFVPGAPPVALANGVLILCAGILTVLQKDKLEMNRFTRNIS